MSQETNKLEIEIEKKWEFLESECVKKKLIEWYKNSGGGILGVDLFPVADGRLLNLVFARKLIDFPPTFLEYWKENDPHLPDCCKETPADGKDYPAECYRSLSAFFWSKLIFECGQVSLFKRDDEVNPSPGEGTKNGKEKVQEAKDREKQIRQDVEKAIKDAPVFRASFDDWATGRDLQPRIRIRPPKDKPPHLRIGTRIGHSTGRFGTLGTFVYRNRKNGPPVDEHDQTPYLLSCWHVLAHEGSKTENRIVSPRLGHVGDLDGPLVLPWKWGTKDYRGRRIDAAIARVTDEYRRSAQGQTNHLASVCPVGRYHDKALYMVGGKSQLRVGKVAAFSTYVFKYEFGDPFCMSGFRIEATMAEETLSSPGDSGSIWYVNQEVPPTEPEPGSEPSPTGEEEPEEAPDFQRIGVGLHVNGGRLIVVEEEPERESGKKRLRLRRKQFAFANRLEIVYCQLKLDNPKKYCENFQCPELPTAEEEVAKKQEGLTTANTLEGYCPKCGELVRVTGTLVASEEKKKVPEAPEGGEPKGK